MSEFFRIKYVYPSDEFGTGFIATTLNDNITSQDEAGDLIYKLKDTIFYKYLTVPDRITLSDNRIIKYYLDLGDYPAPLALYVDHVLQVPDPPPIALINSEYIGPDLFSVTAIMSVPVTIPVEFHYYVPDLDLSGSINSLQGVVMNQIVSKVYTESFFLNDLKIALGI